MSLEFGISRTLTDLRSEGDVLVLADYGLRLGGHFDVGGVVRVGKELVGRSFGVWNLSSAVDLVVARVSGLLAVVRLCVP